MFFYRSQAIRKRLERIKIRRQEIRANCIALHIWTQLIFSRFDVPNDRSVNTIYPRFINRLLRLILFLGPATRPPSREPSHSPISFFFLFNPDTSYAIRKAESSRCLGRECASKNLIKNTFETFYRVKSVWRKLHTLIVNKIKIKIYFDVIKSRITSSYIESKHGWR